MKFKLVKKIDEATVTKSFFFTSDEEFSWQAGQYAYLTLGDITKQFTIASSPTEEFIQITTRIRKESDFKQKLDSLEIGGEIEARAPFGSFTINLDLYSSSHLFIAGGIGITPFRSMIKYNIDKQILPLRGKNLKLPMYLIYSNSDSEFVFKKELDSWQKGNEFIKVHYVNTSEAGRIDKLKIESLIRNFKLKIDNCMFWSVGPNVFVNAMEDTLEKLGIKSDMIQTEKFIGY